MVSLTFGSDNSGRSAWSSRSAWLCVAVVGAFGLPACSIPYLAHVSYGQARILVGRVSIEQRLEDPSTGEREKGRLGLVLDVKRYAHEVLGLTPSGSYSSVFDTGGEPAVWNVSACKDDAFVPHSWSFPVVGTVPYKGFFDRELARGEARALMAEAKDVLVYGAIAYSTLGWFDDPIFTPMLARLDEEELANTVLHELAHATVYVESDADFNENLATFVGDQGAIDYFRARGGKDDPRLVQASDSRLDAELFAHEVGELRARLAKVYESAAPRAEKLARKADELAAFQAHYRAAIRPRLRHPENHDFQVLERELNNAWILALERYHADLGLFGALHAKLGSNLARTVERLRELARAESPRAALRAAVAE